MKFIELQRVIENDFCSTLEQWLSPIKIEFKFSEPYNVKNNWWNKNIPYAAEEGLYFYVHPQDDNILYIGKGQIGKRSSSAHLKKSFQGQPEMFPSHQWQNYANIDRDIKYLITHGDFILYTMMVKPGYLSSIFEVFAQTYCNVKDGKLPVLNNKIG